MVITLEREPAGPRPAGSRASAAPAAPPRPAGPSVLVWRARLAAACLGFVGLALSQSPGRVLADTKLDMAVDPLAFLGRALQLWDAEGFAGQVQNQAYGYLFPMGPFFALGDVVGLPPWIVQRLWLALLLCTAFLGVVALARRLGIGTPATALVAGVAYALAPRVITALGETSVEIVPLAVAPWVLVPLVRGRRAARSPRRAAALSGLAVVCAGGVNAVAAARSLPLPVLWLLDPPGGTRPAAAGGLVGGGRGAGHHLVGRPAAAAGPVQPALPRLHRDGADDHRADRRALGPAGDGALGRLPGRRPAPTGRPAGPWCTTSSRSPARRLSRSPGWSRLTRADLPERTWLVLGLLAGRRW